MTMEPPERLPHEMTEEQYRRLPENIAREIEVVHGHVIVCESPVPEHNRVARRLASAMEQLPSTEPCIRAETDIDVVLWRVPKFTFRRPDVTVYRCLPERGAKPEAADALIGRRGRSVSCCVLSSVRLRKTLLRAGYSMPLVACDARVASAGVATLFAFAARLAGSTKAATAAAATNRRAATLRASA
ncbi:putative restriction endonuclease [Nocardia amikacinitolerans]|nr:putative restriction endonuclease [Nocardia amikacinitolerans]